MKDDQSARMKYGEIRFCPKGKDEHPDPPHFKTSFYIETNTEVGGIEVFNAIQWNGFVLADAPDAPYSEIESQAARDVVSSLRSLADSLERQLDEHQQRVAERD